MTFLYTLDKIIRKTFRFKSLAIGLLLSCQPLSAQDVFPADAGSDQPSQAELQGEKPTPFFINAFADLMNNTKINNSFFKGEKFRFAIANIEAGFVYYYNSCYQEGLSASIAYSATLYDWRGNPWFDQQEFDTTIFTFAGFSKRLDNWYWKGMIQVNIDGWDWESDYMYYNIMAWGRNALSENWGLHVGFFAETGMNIDRIYPILGFDWKITERWKLNAVFPFDMSIQYFLTDHWILSLAGRTFDVRHRVSKKNNQNQYLARYLNSGAELMLKYDYSNLAVNIHAGSTFGGTYRISDRNNNRPHHYKLDPTLYGGAEVNFRF